MENQFSNTEPKEEYKSEEEKMAEMPEEERFEREYYEPAIVSSNTNFIGWTIAVILFVLAVWLLWVAMR